MPRFRIVIFNADTGVTAATTYTSAGTQDELCAAIREEVEYAENGDSDWLDGAFEDETE